MNKIKFVATGLIVFSLVSGSADAQAQRESQWGGGNHRQKIFKQLNLTGKQQKKLEENRQVQQEKMMQLRTAMQQKQARLEEALKDSAVTLTTVEPLANEIKSLQAQMIDIRISGIFAVKQILTPEQFAKFQQIMAEKKGHFPAQQARHKGERRGNNGWGR